MSIRLSEAALRGDTATVSNIITYTTDVNVNWRNPNYDYRTALHSAACHGHDEIVALLLQQPYVDVNPTDGHGYTPFMLSCIEGRTKCAKMLLSDTRVNVDVVPRTNVTAIKTVILGAKLEILKWWIIYERNIDLGFKDDEDSVIAFVNQIKWLWRTTKEASEYQGVIELLDSFENDEEGTRFKLKAELGLIDGAAGGHFANIVFLCDGLFEFASKDKIRASTDASRFLKIAMALPLDLQMVLCYRVVGSRKSNIPAATRESAFRRLARYC